MVTNTQMTYSPGRKKTRRTLVLIGNKMVNPVNIFKWAKSKYHFKKDRNAIRNVMKSWGNLTTKEWDAILLGKVDVKLMPKSEKVVIKF